MGHLEACAAAAGLASLVVTPLLAGVVPGNAQLRWLNAHVVSLLSGCPGATTFQMPVDTSCVSIQFDAICSFMFDHLTRPALLSSFGFSGTIAHARVVYHNANNDKFCTILISLFRRKSASFLCRLRL